MVAQSGLLIGCTAGLKLRINCSTVESIKAEDTISDRRQNKTSFLKAGILLPVPSLKAASKPKIRKPGTGAFRTL